MSGRRLDDVPFGRRIWMSGQRPLVNGHQEFHLGQFLCHQGGVGVFSRRRVLAGTAGGELCYLLLRNDLLLESVWVEAVRAVHSSFVNNRNTVQMAAALARFDARVSS